MNKYITISTELLAYISQIILQITYDHIHCIKLLTYGMPDRHILAMGKNLAYKLHNSFLARKSAPRQLKSSQNVQSRSG